jgi:hypothetical protein
MTAIAIDLTGNFIQSTSRPGWNANALCWAVGESRIVGVGMKSHFFQCTFAKTVEILLWVDSKRSCGWPTTRLRAGDLRFLKEHLLDLQKFRRKEWRNICSGSKANLMRSLAFQ